MNGPATRRFTARAADFDAMREFIESACARIEDHERQRAVLLVEELFANSVYHGYGGECDEPVWLSIDIDDRGCRLVYEDRAPAYNPFVESEHPDLDNAVPEDRPIGGLGIVFLNELSSEHSYARLDERNVIDLRIKTGAVR